MLRFMPDCLQQFATIVFLWTGYVGANRRLHSISRLALRRNRSCDTFGIIWPNSFGDIWHTFVADRFGSPRLELLLREARTAKIIPKKLCQSIRKVTRSFESRRCHSLLRNVTIAGITWSGASSISQ